MKIKKSLIFIQIIICLFSGYTYALDSQVDHALKLALEDIVAGFNKNHSEEANSRSGIIISPASVINNDTIKIDLIASRNTYKEIDPVAVDSILDNMEAMVRKLCESTDSRYKRFLVSGKAKFLYVFKDKNNEVMKDKIFTCNE